MPKPSRHAASVRSKSTTSATAATFTARRRQSTRRISSNYVPGMPDRRLADLHEHQELINDCVRNTGTETSRAPQ